MGKTITEILKNAVKEIMQNETENELPMDGDETEGIAKELLKYLNKANGND